LVATLAVLALSLVSFSARGAEEKAAAAPSPASSQKVSEAASHFLKASLLYQQKKYDQAGAEIEEAMKLQPSAQEIVQLRDQIGEATLVGMLSHPKLRDAARSILQLAEQETMRKQTDPAEIKKWVKDLESEEFAVYWKAVTELIVIGDYAVPYLLQPLCDANPTHASSLAIVTLNRMGWKAVLPLVAALKSDNPVLRQNVCVVLGNSADPRAVPPLKALCEDPEENSVVSGQAEEAIQKITGRTLKDLPSAGQLYHELAEKYYAGDYKVLHALVDSTMLVWRWEGEPKAAAPQATVAEKLQYFAVPRYMFNRIMAENACFEGMAADPSNMKLISTLVATYFNAMGDISAALRGYQMSTLGFKFSEEELKTLEAMDKATHAWRRLAEMTGSKYINQALERALAEGNGPMAGACIQSLRAVRDDSPHAGVSGLILAMGDPDKFVRYAAAEALVTIAPRGNLGGETLAMRVMAAALTETARRTILIAGRNTQLTNALKAALRSNDFNIIEVSDMNAATSQIRKSFMPVDIVVVEHALAGSDTISFARRLKKGLATPNIGVIVTTDKDAEEIQKAYGLFADAVLNNATASKELMDKVQAILSRPGIKVDEKAVVQAVRTRAAKAVAALDPETSAYPMQGLVPALTFLLSVEDETLRTLALVALGKIGDPRANGEIVKIICDKNQSEKLRGAALMALGEIFQRTRKISKAEYEAIDAALMDPKVRAQAAIALGKAGLGPKTLSTTLTEVRPSIRSQSVGGTVSPGSPSPEQ
jgi:HEAT repeat protein